MFLGISGLQCFTSGTWIIIGRPPLENFQSLKDKVCYGQEPPSGESTTTECEVNYQQLAVITELAELGTPGCCRPQPVTDNGVRDGRSN